MILRYIIIITLMISTASAGHLDEWRDFKQRHGKNYSPSEESQRRSNFMTRLAVMKVHNKEAKDGKHSFTLGINRYADMTVLEMQSKMNGYRREDRAHHQHHHHPKPRPGSSTTATTTTEPTLPPSSPTTDSLNDTTLTTVAAQPSTSATMANSTQNSTSASTTNKTTVDWRTQGYVTWMKDQGQCGSCWAFSATGALEGQHFKATKQLVSLSEQDLVDSDHLDFGCNGGYPEMAFHFIMNETGINTESSYPYLARKGPSCLSRASSIGATVSGVVTIPSGSEPDLQEAVANVGPVSVAIDASHVSFQMYASGIYYEPKCSSTFVDHSVLVVGFGTEDCKDYWLVKNSWGTTWGMEGYIKMSRNRDNNCGIAKDACYPLV